MVALILVVGSTLDHPRGRTAPAIFVGACLLGMALTSVRQMRGAASHVYTECL